MRPHPIRRRTFVASAATALVGLGLPLPRAAARSGTSYSAASILATAGQVVGVIVCSEEGGGALPTGAATVYLKGSAFTARTRDDGRFVIDYVPPGTYRLDVMTAGRRVRATKSVTVDPHTTTDVGTISVVGGCAAGCGGGTCEEGRGRSAGGGCPVAAMAAKARRYPVSGA